MNQWSAPGWTGDWRNKGQEFVSHSAAFLQLVQVFLSRENLTVHEHGEHQGQDLTREEDMNRSLHYFE